MVDDCQRLARGNAPVQRKRSMGFITGRDQKTCSSCVDTRTRTSMMRLQHFVSTAHVIFHQRNIRITCPSILCYPPSTRIPPHIKYPLNYPLPRVNKGAISQVKSLHLLPILAYITPQREKSGMQRPNV